MGKTKKYTLLYTYTYIYIYIYIYIYRHTCNHENNVPSRLSPQWLCGNLCTWAHVLCHKVVVVITGRVHCFHDYM